MIERVMNSRNIGLARALSKLGYCSRSQAAALIRAGRVLLNGETRRDPETPVRLGRDRIEVYRRAIQAESRIYLMLNKPRGLVTTASDEKNRETVYSCLDAGLPWVGPVGRLDKATEGLLLFTNDSEWAARISDPQTHVQKIYHVQVGVLADEGLEAALTKGVRTASGELLRAQHARLLRRGERNTVPALIFTIFIFNVTNTIPAYEAVIARSIAAFSFAVSARNLPLAKSPK
jgi:23S rRNA pseudouridine2605 synthase